MNRIAKEISQDEGVEGDKSRPVTAARNSVMTSTSAQHEEYFIYQVGNIDGQGAVIIASQA